MHLRKASLQAAKHLAIPVEREFGMQAAHDMKFGDGFTVAISGLMPDLFERHRVCFRIAFLLAERAQLATGDTDIGGIDVAIDVEVSLVAVKAFANLIRHPADPQQIRSPINRQPVLKGQPLSGSDLSADRFETRIFKRGSHTDRARKMSVAQNRKNITLT